jgi:hypothetical protein
VKDVDFHKVLDHHNNSLWLDLNNHFEITVTYHDKPYAELFSKNKIVEIFLNNDVNSASFTHELLHLWIEKKGIYIGSSFKLLIKGNPKLAKVLSPLLLDHIGNTCEHSKMFQKFLSLGYSPSQFLYDNDIHKCTENEIKSIEKHYKVLWATWRRAIDLYIGKFFAIHADHNIGFDYSNCKKRLEAVDGQLYLILNTFWNDWINYDIEKEDGINVSYHQIAFEFYDNLDEWIKHRKLI